MSKTPKNTDAEMMRLLRTGSADPLPQPFPAPRPDDPTPEEIQAEGREVEALAEKLGAAPAFTVGGLSTRLWLAGQALAGLGRVEDLNEQDIAAEALARADALLKRVAEEQYYGAPISPPHK